MSTDSWKILQLSPATGWVARFRGATGDLSELPLASWALVDDGTRTSMVGMTASGVDPACRFVAPDERFAGYVYRGAEVAVAAELPQAQRVAKSGVAWKSTMKTDGS